MTHTPCPEQDERFMHYAFRVGEQFLGQVWPNPAVGCVIVKDGIVLSVGATQKGGRPHAEVTALSFLTPEQAKGSTVYVTLEPCSHTGKTPPCVDALIQSQVARVVASVGDIDPRVNGRGFQKLREAGIEVTTGVLEDMAHHAHAGFFRRVSEGMPWVTVKAATSLDGCIATKTGHSQWITGTQARQFVHRLRSRYDALITGIGTVLADDPLLTCRLSGLGYTSPVRVVLDTHLRLPLESQLVKTALNVPVWVMTAVTDERQWQPFINQGVKVFPVSTHKGCLSILDVLKTLGREGITRAFVEAGQGVTTAFMAENLVDTLIWMKAPFCIGGDGLKAIGSLGLETLANAQKMMPVYSQIMGQDQMNVYQKQPCNNSSDIRFYL